MMMCLGVFLFGYHFFGTLWASRTSWKSISFTRLGNFSFIMFSDKFSISCSCSSPSGTPMIQILERLKLSQRFLSLSIFFEFLILHSVLAGCLFLPFVLDHWLSPSFLPFTVGSLCVLLYFTLGSLHLFLSFCGQAQSVVSILITSVLNSASDRLAISLLLSFFLEFCSVLLFGPYIFASVHLLCCRVLGS